MTSWEGLPGLKIIWMGGEHPQVLKIKRRAEKNLFWLFLLRNNRMAITVKLNFDETYDIDEISPDLRIIKFETPVADGTNEAIKIEIDDKSHELKDDLYNLAFGPMDSRGNINDKAQISHSDYSKVFSTILLSGLTYLKTHPEHYLGIDGSDEARAYLYNKFLQRNYDYLSEYFNLYGLKYYVRITRFGKTQYENPFDFEDVLPETYPIIKGEQIPSGKLYNYFVFNLKK